MNPHIFRTHDGGKTWTEIVNGIPGGAPVSVVREDPKRKGLLFAGSETQVYVSFDDGDHWQSLRLNMAASSVRDLVIKDDDLVVGTHGRGIWILDDITPLRQLAEMANATAGAGSATTLAEQEVILFKPQPALRVRWNMNTDTPMPPDEPAGPNPPEGAIIDYYLKSAASGPVTLEIIGADGKPVRKYSSTDTVFTPDPKTSTIPLYWYRPLAPLSASAGMHRFTWDVHYQPLDGGGRLGGPNLPIAAIGHNTIATPTTPWVNPGQFTVKLTVNEKTYSQPIAVKPDPRVKTPALAMEQVYSLSKALYYGAIDVQAAARQARAIRDQIAARRAQASGPAADALTTLDRTIEALVGTPAAGGDTLSAVGGGLAGVMNSLQGADVRPTTVQVTAIARARAAAARAMAKWAAIRSVDVPAANTKLTAAGVAAITF
jgi:hypothetical protein